MSDEIAQLRAQLAAATAERDRLAATPTIDAALASVGVRPGLRKAVRAMFLARRIELDGSDVHIDDVPADAAVRAWAATQEGLAHIGDGKDQAAPKQRRSEMSREEKSAYCLRYGVAAFEKLPR